VENGEGLVDLHVEGWRVLQQADELIVLHLQKHARNLPGKVRILSKWGIGQGSKSGSSNQNSLVYPHVDNFANKLLLILRKRIDNMRH
jgi:hypothetical protein